MAAFVLDASLAISWCFPNDPTENTAHSRAIPQLVEQDDVVVLPQSINHRRPRSDSHSDARPPAEHRAR